MSKLRRSGGKPFAGVVEVPGDKSISHRALIFAALAKETSRISGIGPGDDIRATEEALVAMGAEITEDGASLVVQGFGVRGAREPNHVLDVRNSGTAMRILLAVCASGRGEFVLSGDASLNQRPMLRVVEPLRAMGAEIRGREGGRLAPLSISGQVLQGGTFTLQQASAQVRTALLIAGLAAEGQTKVIDPAPSRDHTERMLAALGVEVQGDQLERSVLGRRSIPAADWRVPADPSSAMFVLAAASLVPGSSIQIPGVCLNPLRIGAFEVLRDMGGDIDWMVEDHWGGEPVGTVTARWAPLHGVEVTPEKIPSLIDELPALAILAAFAEGDTRVTGAEELRVKESDRIRSIVDGLLAVGGEAEDLPDGFVVRGERPLKPGIVESHGDHRIAMSFAVAGIAARQNITVKGWSSVDTSFPGFLETMRQAQGI